MSGGPVLDGPEAAEHGRLEPARARRGLKALAARGAVVEGAPKEVGWERPNRRGTDPKSAYCLSNRWGYAVGVAAGHRGVGTGLIDARGRFREHGSTAPECLVDEAIAVGADYMQTLQSIADQIFQCIKLRRDQLRQLGQDTAVDVRAITLGIPGQITGVRDADPSRRRVATVLRNFGGKPVASDLGAILARYEAELGFDPRTVPIRLENDADCAAVGELHWGKGRGCRSLIVVKVSAGIGAGMILDGCLHYGHEATAGEIGHDPVHPAVLEHLNTGRPKELLPLDPESEFLECSCPVPNSGHLEAFASGTAVTCRTLARRKRDIDLDSWRESAAEVVEDAVRGRDEKAVRAIRDAGFLIGRRINTLAAAIGPERVLVTGPLADAGALFLGAIHDEIEGGDLPTTHAPRDVTLGTAGEAARWIGVYGAARLALEEGVWGPVRTVGSYPWPGYQAAEALVRAEAGKRANKREPEPALA
ncbi:MAG TPA: ROK family protein [Thermoleophilaceae bacterium]